MKLQAAFRLAANWWTDLGPEGQQAYIDQHPKSKKAKEAKEKQGKGAEQPTTEGPKSKAKEGEGQQPAKQKPLAPGKPLAEYAKSKDDPHVTVEKIYSNFKPEDVQEMKDKTAEAMKLAPSDKKYADQQGNYSPERQVLHDKIMKSILTPERIKAATPEPGTKPTFVVLGGRGGSGKSSFTHDEATGAEPTVNEFDSRKFLTLDADAIKQLLDPPYEGWNANQVHEESSYLFDKVFDAAQKMGLNVISDATLKSDKMGPVLQGMIDQGYEIEGHYMFLPRQKAAVRACGRYLKDGPQNRGRLVPPEVILGNTKNEENFDKLKGYFKKWSCYDNDQPKGQPPQLIDHSDHAPKKEEARTKVKTMSTIKQVPVQANPALYDADDWEDDPFLKPSARRAEKVATESLETLKNMGIRSGQVRDPATRKAYIAYLKSL